MLIFRLSSYLTLLSHSANRVPPRTGSLYVRIICPRGSSSLKNKQKDIKKIKKSVTFTTLPSKGKVKRCFTRTSTALQDKPRDTNELQYTTERLHIFTLFLDYGIYLNGGPFLLDVTTAIKCILRKHIVNGDHVNLLHSLVYMAVAKFCNSRNQSWCNSLNILSTSAPDMLNLD